MARGALQKAACLATSQIHWKRYWLFKAKVSVEDIAKRDKVSENTVKESIAAVDAYRQQYHHDVVTERVNEVIVKTSAKAGKALERALEAKLEPEGKVRKNSHDFMVQLKAVSEFRGLVEAVQPKGGGLNVSVKNQAAAQAASSPRVQSSGFGFEERLKKIRERVDANNQLPGEVGTVIEADDLTDEESDEVMVEGTTA